MGRRKERRLASITNAGRRFKLDLFAEPSGDLGGSGVNEEIGGNIESTQRTGLPNSPSSSVVVYFFASSKNFGDYGRIYSLDQQPQNPLLLLGQYSDDELDEDLNKRVDHETVKSSPSACDAEVADPIIEGCKDMDITTDENLATPKINKDGSVRKSIDVSESSEGANKRENDAAVHGDLNKERDVIEQVSVAGTSDAQVVGDVSSVWKIVLHEESNSYYYWNTETGETSWEVPDVLAQVHQPTTEQSIFPESLTLYKQESNLTNGSIGADAAGGSVDVSSMPESQMNGFEGSTLLFNANQSELTSNSESANGCFVDKSSSTTPSVPARYMHNMVVAEEHKSVFDLPSQLISQSRSLLDRLKSLKGSNYLQGYDWTLKYIIEIHTRLSDFGGLISYETSLLPYWEHSERQLKRLESAINEEIYQMAVSSQLDVHATDFQLEENRKFQCLSEAERVKSGTSTCEDTPNAVVLVLDQGDLQNEAPVEHVSSLEAAKELESHSQVSEQVNDSFSHESAFKHSLNSVEEVDMDVDMDVDMEVEDSDSEENRTTDVESAKEKSGHPEPPAGNTSTLLEEGPIVPPSPDEEWIPPPPPYDEDVPLPPPDDPLAPSHPLPPSYSQIPPPLYTEQINMPYSDSNFEYYGLPVAEVSNANFYGHSDVPLPHAPLYYAAVSNAYSDTAPIIFNPSESEAYNGSQDGLIPGLPLVISAGSSQLFPASASGAFNNPAPDHIESTAVANVKVDVYPISGAEKVHGGNTAATIQAPPNVSIKDNDASLPINTVSAAPATSTVSAVSKSQSKGTRSKKRTVAVAPSIRSNKKVSSLVDKWKAAKEELLEDEEEPETAYEMLERKRQREIEEWHALQIASREVKQNANFQPLGGDWRERIKRRRGQSAKETIRSSPETPHEGNEQPDLIELSRNLPSGWQAYWDESSNKVYYGNLVTSETTWTLPK